MTRPSAPVLLTDLDATGKTDILSAPALWCLKYKSRHFTERRIYQTDRKEIVKYIKTTYTNPAHAYHHRDKLNSLFDCEDFSVHEYQ